MTTRYVDGTNGNDTYDGSSPTFVSGTTGPKKTLTAMEAIVAAGDLVHVRSGVYRETLTLGVSGTAGSPIEYRGDYAGLIWTGGGVVRITGSNDDITATRASCITQSVGRSYRTFTNFQFDSTTSILVWANGKVCSDWTINKCVFMVSGSQAIRADNGNTNWVIQNSVIYGTIINYIGILFNNSTKQDNAGHVVDNCIFLGGGVGVEDDNVGGVILKNNTHVGGTTGISLPTTLNAGQLLTVNNCSFYGLAVAVTSASTTYFTEDYNNFYGCGTNRTNVTAGANSKTYPPLFDTRWFFQLVNAGAGANNSSQVVSPFDLSQYSQLINVAGTSPSTTDMRGTAAIDSVREWGALEYDSTLKIKAGGGGISRSRAI